MGIRDLVTDLCFLSGAWGNRQKRAVKAENQVLKLKQEMSLLQVTRGPWVPSEGLTDGLPIGLT